MSNVLHYFVNTNGCQGFTSFFKSNFGALNNVIKLENYPTPLVEDIVSEICDMAEERGYQLEIIHSSMDNSVEGVIVPQFKSGLINIPAYVDYGYSVYQLMDDPEIQDMKDHLVRAHECFANAKNIHDNLEKIYISNMNFAKLNQFTTNTVLDLLGGHTRNRKGSAVHRFFGAATQDGPVDYIENLTANIEKRYFIKGRPGTGKSTFLKKLAERAVVNGFHVEIYHCSFDPNSLDLVIIRELGFCLFDSTPPHEYFPTRDKDEVLDFYQISVEEDVDAKYAQEIAELKQGYSAEHVKAKEEISLANRIKITNEKHIFSQINPNKCKNSTNKIIKKIFLRK